VTEQFGRDSHIIMGAVIDEALQNRVEVCVIGTSDIGGRVLARRPLPRARPAAPTAPPPATPAGPELATIAEVRPAELAQAAAAAAAAAKASQEEFGFGEIESRGFFEKTDRNLFDGQDLDVPTYLRKGIKIIL
jgi:cell division protein FtsZ